MDRVVSGVYRGIRCGRVSIAPEGAVRCGAASREAIWRKKKKISHLRFGASQGRQLCASKARGTGNSRSASFQSVRCHKMFVPDYLASFDPANSVNPSPITLLDAGEQFARFMLNNAVHSTVLWGPNSDKVDYVVKSFLASARKPIVNIHRRFGEKSPEAKASDFLHDFFTFVAVKIVMSQLQDYNTEGYEELKGFVDRVSLKDGDQFCAALMRESDRHRGLALRIMEVRSAYTNQDFEWDNLQKLSNKQMEKSNTRLMREFLEETSNLTS